MKLVLTALFAGFSANMLTASVAGTTRVLSVNIQILYFRLVFVGLLIDDSPANATVVADAALKIV